MGKIRSTKRFTFTTEAKNSKGFHVRTKGIELAEYNSNPLLLWMHQRPKGERTDEILPLGNLEDIRDEGNGKMSGVPVFDDTDEFAMKIYNKVENGTIRMASAGLKPLQFVDHNGDKWLERSVLKEVSLVDIGSNSEALAVTLYNDADEVITLSEAFDTTDITPKNKDNMKLLQLSEGTVSLLKLSENANEADAHKAILNLVTLADTQKGEIDKLKQEKADIEKKLEDQLKLSEDAELVALVDKAVEDRKITADQKEDFVKLGLEPAKNILGKMKATPTVTSQLGTAAGGTDNLMKLSYDELDKSGQLITLKEQNIEGFKEKFKSKFGKEYQG
ncbi:hypothetical protein Q4603_05710 [Zobellia galactanivorans]|uniref:hypothetical protein n=1 Tax=Zobellia galactanivorans (strain DSM 12802 / CCUG 47099 / CIP 106680 / NCIMB 13871 / Dsij) TaxID=63186 RepID=UPI0026E4290C|nr:hypothetical protein [Zobellia galactanivorans]MDO6808091.1 hypothetical protein [Zobellia galactanivorans]